MLYNDFGIHALFTLLKTITLPWVTINLIYILTKQKGKSEIIMNQVG